MKKDSNDEINLTGENLNDTKHEQDEKKTKPDLMEIHGQAPYMNKAEHEPNKDTKSLWLGGFYGVSILFSFSILVGQFNLGIFGLFLFLLIYAIIPLIVRKFTKNDKIMRGMYLGPAILLVIAILLTAITCGGSF